MSEIRFCLKLALYADWNPPVVALRDCEESNTHHAYKILKTTAQNEGSDEHHRKLPSRTIFSKKSLYTKKTPVEILAGPLNSCDDTVHREDPSENFSRTPEFTMATLYREDPSENFSRTPEFTMATLYREDPSENFSRTP